MVDGDVIVDRSEWRFGFVCATLWRKDMSYFWVGAVPAAVGRGHVFGGGCKLGAARGGDRRGDGSGCCRSSLSSLKMAGEQFALIDRQFVSLFCDEFADIVLRARARAALDAVLERTVLCVDDIVWAFKMCQTQVRGVRVVREVQGQTGVLSVLLSCVW